MVGRAENVTAEGLVAAGAVGPRGRIAARAVETAEVSRARGCGAVGATKAVRLAKAGCRAVGATKVARLAKAGCRQKSRDWPKPGAAVQRGRQKLRGGPKPGAAGQRGRAAVAGSVHITRMCRRCGCVGPPRWLRRWSVSGLPGRRGAPHTPVGSGSCPQSQRGWWRMCGLGCAASSAGEGVAARVRRSSNRGHVGRRYFSRVGRRRFSRLRSPPPHRGERPTSAWPVSQVPGCPRRVLGDLGGGGGPSVAAWMARGSGAAGRNPRVRPVPEPELPRMSMEGTGEVSRGGREAEGDGEAALLSVVEAEVVGEDMLREARKGAKGAKSRGGYMRPAVKGGWLAASVVTRGVVAGIRCSCTGACRWGVKGGVEWYILGIRAGTSSISSSIAFERTVPGGEATTTSQVARKASRRWERSAFSVNGGTHASGSVVTTAELEWGEGRASMSKLVPSKSTLSTGCGRGRCCRPLGGVSQAMRQARLYKQQGR